MDVVLVIYIKLISNYKVLVIKRFNYINFIKLKELG